MPPDSATLSSALRVERAMPPTKLHIAVLSPLGPNPERNPANTTDILRSICYGSLNHSPFVDLKVPLNMYLYIFLTFPEKSFLHSQLLDIPEVGLSPI